MSKVPYTTLKLKTNTDVNTFKFNGKTIEVLKYLPTSDKYDLVMITLQKAEENGFYNAVKMDIYFHLYLVYMYTNISFTEKQREDEIKIFDQLVSSGFMEKFLMTMPQDEYNDLLEYLNNNARDRMKFIRSAGGVMREVIEDLPKNAEIAKTIVDNFDPNKFAAVRDFARAANGDRAIPATTL